MKIFAWRLSHCVTRDDYTVHKSAMSRTQLADFFHLFSQINAGS